MGAYHLVRRPSPRVGAAGDKELNPLSREQKEKPPTGRLARGIQRVGLPAGLSQKGLLLLLRTSSTARHERTLYF